MKVVAVIGRNSHVGWTAQGLSCLNYRGFGLDGIFSSSSSPLECYMYHSLFLGEWGNGFKYSWTFSIINQNWSNWVYASSTVDVKGNQGVNLLIYFIGAWWIHNNCQNNFWVICKTKCVPLGHWAVPWKLGISWLVHLSETSVPALCSQPGPLFFCKWQWTQCAAVLGQNECGTSVELAQATCLRTNSEWIKKFALPDLFVKKIIQLLGDSCNCI